MKYDKSVNQVIADRDDIEKFMSKWPNSGMQNVYQMRFHIVAFMGLAVNKVLMYGKSRHLMGQRAMKMIDPEAVGAISKQVENFITETQLAPLRSGQPTRVAETVK